MAWIETVYGTIYNLSKAKGIGYKDDDYSRMMMVYAGDKNNRAVLAEIPYTPVNKNKDRAYKLESGQVISEEMMTNALRNVALYVAGVADSMLVIKQADITKIINKELE